MFNPSAAPRWKSTTSFLPPGPVVAATARCKNAGRVLMPIMAMPPPFRNARRETAMVFSFVFHRSPPCRGCKISCSKRAQARVPALLKALTMLEFRGAQHQARDQAVIHLRHRIVKARLQHLRIAHLRFERFARLGRHFAGEQDSDGAIKFIAGLF